MGDSDKELTRKHPPQCDIELGSDLEVRCIEQAYRKKVMKEMPDPVPC